MLIVNADVGDLDHSYPAACAELDRIDALLHSGNLLPSRPAHLTTPLRPLFDQASYCAMVKRVKQYIREGDIFQVVLSNRLEAGFEGSFWTPTVSCARKILPLPTCFLLYKRDDISWRRLSRNPEKLENGILHTFPLAGTPPRGRTAEEGTSRSGGGAACR